MWRLVLGVGVAVAVAGGVADSAGPAQGPAQPQTPKGRPGNEGIAEEDATEKARRIRRQYSGAPAASGNAAPLSC